MNPAEFLAKPALRAIAGARDVLADTPDPRDLQAPLALAGLSEQPPSHRPCCCPDEINAAAGLLLAANAVIVDRLRAASRWGLEASVAAR